MQWYNVDGNGDIGGVVVVWFVTVATVLASLHAYLDQRCS